MAQRADLETYTLPEDCALAVAVPLTREAFFEDLASGSKSDFARFMIGADDPEIGWRNTGSIVAEAIAHLIEIAEQCGVNVLREARLDDFARLFGGDHTVVTFVAHWRGAWLTGRDIAAEPGVVIAQIAEARSSAVPGEAIQEIVIRIAPHLPKVLTHEDPAERLSFFAEALNDYVIKAPPLLRGLLPKIGVETVAVGDLWLQTWHRDALDLCAGGTIHPGNRLELRDGLHRPEIVAARVPTIWSGHVDLTVCHSAILGHFIKAGRPGRRLILRNRPVGLVISSLILRHLYQDLRTNGYNYTKRLAELLSMADHILEKH